MPVRFKVLGMRPGESIVRGFAPNPVIRNNFINGGFYFFKSTILCNEYFAGDSGVVLEDHILEKLSVEGQLLGFLYEGAWQHLDCERDVAMMEKFVNV